MTQATHLFFDHPYEPDPEERGYYWATRFTNTKKTFEFMPDNLYANADAKRNGEPIEDLCENMYRNKCVPLEKPENIAGILFLYTELFSIEFHHNKRKQSNTCVVEANTCNRRQARENTREQVTIGFGFTFD